MSRYAKAFEGGGDADRVAAAYVADPGGRARGERDWLWLMREAPCWEFIFLAPYTRLPPGALVRVRLRRVRSSQARLPWSPDDELLLWTAEGLDQPRAAKLYASDGRRWAQLRFPE